MQVLHRAAGVQGSSSFFSKELHQKGSSQLVSMQGHLLYHRPAPSDLPLEVLVTTCSSHTSPQ